MSNVPCKHCGTQTQNDGTKTCDFCYEVESSLRNMTAENIEKMLRNMGFQARVMGSPNN